MRTTLAAAVLLTAVGRIALGDQSPVSADAPVLYENARLIAGDGSPVIERAAMVVDKGVIVRVGPAGGIVVSPSMRRVDLSGKTIIPALIGTHGHPGFQQGVSYSGRTTPARRSKAIWRAPCTSG